MIETNRYTYMFDTYTHKQQMNQKLLTVNTTFIILLLPSTLQINMWAPSKPV